ncbi:helix-turn-helix domain-containing protein [Labilibacter marinus]|uniref:helix-turn-helix domain-containing protein n=1 Tax=Labilibacter marinus TaxID=1477105 RepID=UPI00094F66EC|nr:AraC family transcriptional regulator [Labilibacter marinus]
MRAKLKPVVKSEGQSVLVKNDKLKSFYAPHHYHPDYEIIYIKKSFGLRVIGNHINNYQAGEIVILGPGLPHYHELGGVDADEEYPIETIAVLFSNSIFESNSQFPEFAQLGLVLEQIKYGIELVGDTNIAVREILERMTITPSLSNYLSLFKILEVLAQEDSTYKRLSTVKYDNKKVYNDKTKHVLDYLAVHYLNNIGISTLSEHVGMSRSGFCNFFKAQTGVTFSHYLNQLRVSKACELLVTSKKSVSEIAYEVGYENLAYFNRRFKEIKGVTPKAYKTSLLSE